MRYKEYKPTSTAWVKSIPDTWVCKKIGALFSQRKTKVSDKDYPALSVAKIGVVPQLDTAVKTDAGDNRKLVCANDFVINSRSDRKGSCGVSELDGSVSLINIVLTPRQEWNNRYVHYLLRSQPFSEEYYRYGRGIVSDLWTTRYREMKNIMLPVPPRPEQDQIVRYLDWQVSRINKLIAAKKKQKTLFLDYKRSIINSSMKLSNCQRRRLKTLVKEINISDSPNGDFYLGMENVESWTARYIPTKSITEGNGKRFKKGDLLFGKLRPYLAKIYMPAQNGVCSGEFLVLRSYEGYLPFLKYCILSYDFIQLVNSSTYGAKMPRASWNFIGCCSIPHPPYSEQVKLVKNIDKHCIIIDKSIENIDKEISLLHELRTRIISDVVTGQIDVRNIEVPDFEIVEETDDSVDEDDISEETEEQEE